MVAVVDSSPTCSRYCLGLFVAVESKLRWQDPVVYDDWLQMVHSVIFRGASRALFCHSLFCIRVGAVLSDRRWLSLAWIFIQLHSASTVWVESTIAYSELDSFAQGLGLATTPLGEE